MRRKSIFSNLVILNDIKNQNLVPYIFYVILDFEFDFSHLKEWLVASEVASFALLAFQLVF